MTYKSRSICSGAAYFNMDFLALPRQKRNHQNDPANSYILWCGWCRKGA